MIADVYPNNMYSLSRNTMVDMRRYKRKLTYSFITTAKCFWIVCNNIIQKVIPPPQAPTPGPHPYLKEYFSQAKPEICGLRRFIQFLMQFSIFLLHLFFITHTLYIYIFPSSPPTPYPTHDQSGLPNIYPWPIHNMQSYPRQTMTS